MYAIIRERGVDDGYGGTTTVDEFVPLTTELDVVNWIGTYGNHTKYRVVTYTDCQVQKTVRILTPVTQTNRCNCGKKMCPVCRG